MTYRSGTISRNAFISLVKSLVTVSAERSMFGFNLSCHFYLLIRNNLGLQSLETLNWDVLNESVHLLGGVLVVVSATAHSDSDSGGKVSDTLRPDELVEVGVDSDVLGQHDLLDEVLDSADRSRSSLLESLLESHLSQMDSSIPGNWLETLLGGLSGLSCSGH